MTDRLAVVTRLALLALAQFYSAGKVTIIELFRDGASTDVVNVDVTGRAELRDQLADAIIDCDVYHVHEPKCYPWESWTTDGGTQYRGLVGQLLTMWVRLEEITGYVPTPAASDPAAVPGVPAPTGPDDPRWLDTGNGWGYDVPAPRPPVVDFTAAFPTMADWKRAGRPLSLDDMPPVGIDRVNAPLTAPPVNPGFTGSGRLSVLLDDPETARMLTEAAMEWPTPDAAPHTGAAWRKWAMHAIEADLRTGGPFPDYASALAAVRAHPAVKSVEPDDVINLAYGLVTPPPPRPRAPWWTFGGILRPGVAE